MNDKKAKEVIARTADFYPATGCRAGDSGGPYNVGLSGYFLSSAPFAASSVLESRLGFSSGQVSPETSDYRATGFPVRCVQE